MEPDSLFIDGDRKRRRIGLRCRIGETSQLRPNGQPTPPLERLRKMKNILITTIAAVVLVGGENRDEVEQDNWGIITTQQAEFYAARDVPRSQIDLTKNGMK